ILSTFDSIFLSIFPAFVERFNSLLDTAGKIELNYDGSLPTELRIYALMRLGVSDTVTVAKYLGISQNTIYVYKARIKAHAIVKKDNFDDAVMDISR
ncbi:MAG: transcriptional regulator, partial [Muribaculaceae bacterium]|nr:transcriptional regulator [Muribaculaceae bacterium]